MTGIRVKICGLTTPEAAAHAAGAGAAYVGLVFFPPSPRAVTPAQAAKIAAAVPAGVVKVALTVDPDDALLDQIAALPIDMMQLHGSETPDRVTQIKSKLGLPVMKAIGVQTVADLAEIDRYAPVADQLLVDTKPPRGATRPGGNAMTFDWSLIAGRRWPVPWMLAGGLTEANVAEAIRVTGANQLDLSSAVESAPGVKDPALVEAFIATANS